MIRAFIKDHFVQKLKNHSSLVLYDQEGRYHELVEELAKEGVQVFDVNESAIRAREEAIRYWTEALPYDEKKQMLIYLPFARPNDNQEKIFDPFFIFSLSAGIFPDDAADHYKSLCLACYPDQSGQVEQLFSQGEVPDFDTVDAIKGGSDFPKLQSITEEKSEVEVLLTLLFPAKEQEKKLKKGKAWMKEYQRFSRQVIGLNSGATNLSKVQEELWRYLLFSEFVFDLPVSLPEQLTRVPKAEKRFEGIILKTCQRIRDRKYIEETYISKANEIAAQLDLEAHFRDARDLGQIVTFSFEDNTYFNNFVEYLLAAEYGKAAHYLKGNASNQIWRDDQNRSAYWLVGQYAFELLQEIENLTASGEVKFKSLGEAVKLYAEKLWQLDQFHRHFEKSVKEVTSPNENLQLLIQRVRKAYFRFWEHVQKYYLQLISQKGWQFPGILKNLQIFDKKVAPLLQEGKRVAYIMVDALRYELGQALADQLERNFEIKLEPSLAFVPTVTRYAMAALLPKAESLLELKVKGNSLEPFMQDLHIKGPQERLQHIAEIGKYGDRAGLISLDDLLTGSIPKKDLLVVTTTEIDTIGEQLTQSAQAFIESSLRKVIKALHLLEKEGYHQAMLVADHGFVLTEGFQAGDAVSKPVGEWVLQKNRCLGGKGNTNDHLLQLTPEDLGIQAEVTHFQFLKHYAVFKRGLAYFHEGLSLQENVTPFLEVELSKAAPAPRVEIQLSYKGKSTGVITTLRPSIELSSFAEGSLFGEPLSLKVEATDNSGNIVGSPAPGPKVNPSTNLLELEPGQSFKFTMAMEEDFEGTFQVTASDPVTGMVFASIQLKTSYL